MRSFEALSREFFNCLVKTNYPNPGRLGIVRARLQANAHEFASDDGFSILCLALFKAIGEYLATSKQYEIKHTGPVRVGPLTITTAPPNVIYENLPDPIKKRYGVGIHDITDLFEHISVIKETSPSIELLKKTDLLSQTDTYLAWRIRDGLKIAVSPFFGKIKLEARSLLKSWPRDKKTPYWFTGIKNRKQAEDHLYRHLQKCQEEGVNILILPELTIDQDLLKSLKEWLGKKNRERVSSSQNGLIMVVAGSFHMEEKEGTIYNISTILNHKGDVLWNQKKRQPYSFNRVDIKNNPEFKTILNTSNEGGYEKISSTEKIHCLDTALGRICVCICLDYSIMTIMKPSSIQE